MTTSKALVCNTATQYPFAGLAHDLTRTHQGWGWPSLSRLYDHRNRIVVLDEYDALPAGSPERGALLRREALYTSHIAEWRKARDAGAEAALAPKAKARRSPEQVEVERLRRRNERLEGELARTKLALEITGKAHALLELLSESADSDPKSKP